VVGEHQRLAHDHAARLAREEFVDRLLVDDELARACLMNTRATDVLRRPVP
jgi:hypothetical protein